MKSTCKSSILKRRVIFWNQNQKVMTLVTPKCKKVDLGSNHSVKWVQCVVLVLKHEKWRKSVKGFCICLSNIIVVHLQLWWKKSDRVLSRSCSSIFTFSSSSLKNLVQLPSCQNLLSFVWYLTSVRRNYLSAWKFEVIKLSVVVTKNYALALLLLLLLPTATKALNWVNMSCCKKTYLKIYVKHAL